jgi:hypothetical protein
MSEGVRQYATKNVAAKTQEMLSDCMTTAMACEVFNHGTRGREYCMELQGKCRDLPVCTEPC